MPEEAKEEKTSGDNIVKTELKDDFDEVPAQKKSRKKGFAGELIPEIKEDVVIKKHQKEEPDDDVAEISKEDEDAMAPEAEPTKRRNEVPEGTTKFRQDAVHVYGLDFLKTGHMEEIFGQFNHRYVEWINDSSANVVFRDTASARKALESLSYPKSGDEPWRRTPDILVQDDLPAVYLQMRLAVSTDTKTGRKAVPSMNPPQYDTSGGRDSRFSIASLYDKKERTGTAEKGKRPAQVLPEPEIAKRQKRAERFAETLGPPPTEETSAQPDKAEEPAKTEEQRKQEAEEEAKKKAEHDAEEEAKKKRRAERFSSASNAEPSENQDKDAAEKETAENETEGVPAEPQAAEAEKTADAAGDAAAAEK